MEQKPKVVLSYVLKTKQLQMYITTDGDWKTLDTRNDLRKTNSP